MVVKFYFSGSYILQYVFQARFHPVHVTNVHKR